MKPYIDRVVSIGTFENIWKAKRNKLASFREEATCGLPRGWESSTEIWNPPNSQNYEGFQGGPNYGPTSAITGLHSIVDLILFFLPVRYLMDVSKWTNKYGNEDWVVKREKENRYIPGKKYRWYECCNSNHPESRKRFEHKSRKWITCTPGFIYAFFAVLLYRGSQGTNTVNGFWSKKAGKNVP